MKFTPLLLALKKPLQSISYLSLLFVGLRLYEIIIHKPYLLDALFFTVHRLTVSLVLDFCTFFLINIFYVLAYLFFEKYKKDSYHYFRNSLFFLVNLPIFIFFFLDMQTIAVQSRPFTFDLLSTFKWNFLLNLHIYVKDYWYLALTIFFTLFLLVRISFFNSQKEFFNKKQINQSFILSLFLFFISSFIILKSNYLPYQSDRFSNRGFQILIKSYVSLFDKSPINSQLKGNCEPRFFNTKKIHQLLNQNSAHQRVSIPRQASENIILITVESLSKAYVTKELTPFLYDLSQKGVFFKNHLSATTGTSTSILSLVTSSFEFLPKFKSKSIHYLKYLTKSNYKTLFFFGDKKGILGWDKISKQFGFNKHFSREDYEEEFGTKDRDAEGNIFEKEFLKYTASKLKKTKEPFFTFILTNQPHSPYHCDKSDFFKNKSVKEKARYCLRYLDEALKQLFTQLSKESFYNKTLFIITGDHTSNMLLDIKKYGTYFERRNVPLILYHPQKNLKEFESNEVTSHQDILPSVMDYLGLEHNPSFLHHSFFKPRQKKNQIAQYKGFVGKVLGGTYGLINKDYVAQYECSKDKFRLYKNTKKSYDKTIKDPVLIDKYKKIIKAFIQYGHY